MDFMIWVVTIALLGYVVFAMVTAPPSSGCLSADLARARDEARRRALLSGGEAPSGEGQGPQESDARSTRTTSRSNPAHATDPHPPTRVPPVSASADSVVADSLRNPATGERSAVPTNYRFAKRWIKEAMVAEGLLEKVYANSELDADRSEQVRLALNTFKSLEKYRA
jgi:hypothetical protein